MRELLENSRFWYPRIPLRCIRATCSYPAVYQLCQEIAAGRNDWICHLIQGADHALPFQKPELIAELMQA